MFSQQSFENLGQLGLVCKLLGEAGSINLVKGAHERVTVLAADLAARVAMSGPAARAAPISTFSQAMYGVQRTRNKCD